MSAVFTLTVRQLAGSRRWWLVLGLAALPIALWELSLGLWLVIRGFLAPRELELLGDTP